MNEHGHIDSRKALQWLEDDERMYAKIKTMFKEKVPSQVEQLKAFIDAGDCGSVALTAHTIMGSSAMVGASVMSDEAGKLERSAIDGNMISARLHFSTFSEEYEKVMEQLTSDGEN